MAGPVQLPERPADYSEVRRDTVTWEFPEQARDEVRPLMQLWRETWDRIESDLGEELDSRMRVRVGRNASEMHALAPQGMPPPAYAVGVAYPELGLILLTLTAPVGGDIPDIEKVFAHEISHVALHRAVRGQPLPRWFSEGLAIHQARELSFERAKVLMRATYSHERIPLRDLSGRFPSRAYQVDLAYAQSADIVRYLLADERGPDKLRRLVRGVRDGASFADALQTAYYVRPAELEREWIEDLRSRNRLFPVLVGGSIAWVLAALLLPFAYVRRRKRARRKLALMALREEREREQRLQELLKSMREQQALVVMLPPAEALDGADTIESSARAIRLTPRRASQSVQASTAEARPADASPRTIAYIDSESGVPLVQVGDETHTLH